MSEDIAECCAPLGEPLASDVAHTLAARFTALADPAALSLLQSISSTDAGRVCVCEVPTLVGAGTDADRALALLTSAGLLVSERRGNWEHYSVVPAATADVVAALNPGAVSRSAVRR